MNNEKTEIGKIILKTEILTYLKGNEKMTSGTLMKVKAEAGILIPTSSGWLIESISSTGSESFESNADRKYIKEIAIQELESLHKALQSLNDVNMRNFKKLADKALAEFPY